MSIRSTVIGEFESVAKQQNIQLAPLNDDVTLLDSGLDSASAGEGKLPITVGEFVQLYEEALSRQRT
jgi:thiamine biosynthesis lipoprotein ApbE